MMNHHQELHAARATNYDGTSTILSSCSPSSSYHYSVSSLIDHLQFMQQQESAYCITKEYLAVGAVAVLVPSSNTTAETAAAITNVDGTTIATDDSNTTITKITPHDRRALYEWSYQIVDSFMVNRSVACMGISYLDRFMSTLSNNTRAIMALYSRREYQLVLISSLIIALKCHAGIKISLSFMANTLCRGLYTETEIEVMEMDILRTLAWKLNGPCPHDFIDAISGLVSASSPAQAASTEAAPRLSRPSDDVGVVPPDGVVQPSPTAARAMPNSYLDVAAMAKLYVEEVMLDYSRSGLQPSSALAYEALVATLQLRTNELNPLDVMAWTKTIALFTATSSISSSTNSTSNDGNNTSLNQDDNFFVKDPTNKVRGIDESSPSSLTTLSHRVSDVNDQDFKQDIDQFHPTARKVSI